MAFRSLLAQRLYVRSVLLSYLTAFLVTLAASLFLAAGFTSLTVSPFTRLSQWLHRYMDSGEVGKLDIRSRDEIGFLAGAFHGMVSTLIEEKRMIGDQLEQISAPERLQRAHHERASPRASSSRDPRAPSSSATATSPTSSGGGVQP